jgi:hypothetical protein
MNKNPQKEEKRTKNLHNRKEKRLCECGWGDQAAA